MPKICKNCGEPEGSHQCAKGFEPVNSAVLPLQPTREMLHLTCEQLYGDEWRDGSPATVGERVESAEEFLRKLVPMLHDAEQSEGAGIAQKIIAIRERYQSERVDHDWTDWYDGGIETCNRILTMLDDSRTEQALTLPRVERSDSDEDLIYVRLRSGEVANTDEECCNVDRDADGNILGIEYGA